MTSVTHPTINPCSCSYRNLFLYLGKFFPQDIIIWNKIPQIVVDLPVPKTFQKRVLNFKILLTTLRNILKATISVLSDISISTTLLLPSFKLI